MSSSTPETTPQNSMAELLDSFEPMKPLRRGDVVEGIVMRADPDGIFVNIGHKAEGVVPPGEMRSLNRDALQELKVGDEIMTLVVRAETAENAAILSVDRAVGEQGWRILEKAMEAGESVSGIILGFNRGGAIVESEGVQGFVPMSQLVSVSRTQIRETQEAQRLIEEGSRDEADVLDTARPEPSDSAAPEDSAESDDSAAPEDSAESDDSAAPEDSTESDDSAAPEDSAESDDSAAPEDSAESDDSAAPEDSAESDDSAAPEEITESDDSAAPGDSAESDDSAKAAVAVATESEESDTAAPAPAPAPEFPDIGRELELKVLEVNRSRNRAIFSERQAVQQKREEQKARLIEELTEGEVRNGRVTGISSFGAFVDLGGADGLIHISELSWNQVSSPGEVVKVGQEVDVFVLRVDAENKKIALSLRRLQPEPWDSINEQYNVGDIVPATVTKLTNFGAFARVEGSEGSVEGLIHISELSSRMINHPREVVREGDSVKLKILRIEPERRRLGLSLMQAQDEGEF